MNEATRAEMNMLLKQLVQTPHSRLSNGVGFWLQANHNELKQGEDERTHDEGPLLGDMVLFPYRLALEVDMRTYP